MALSLEEFKLINQRTKDVVFGFVHESQKLLPCESNSYFLIPDLIIHVCLAYYYTKHAWRISKDYANSGNNLKLTNDDKRASTQHLGPRTVFSKKSVYGGVNHWRMKIIKMKKDSAWSMTIGVCKKRVDQNVNETDSHNDNRRYLTSRSNTFAFGQADRYGYAVNVGTLIDHTQSGYLGRKYGKKCVAGDIVTMILDLDKLELRYIVNDDEYPVAYDDKQIVKGEYFAALNLYNAGDCVEFL